jgi:glycosyltransferase involved in cell wall biosynthesis
MKPRFDASVGLSKKRQGKLSHGLTRISTDNRDYFLPTDIGRKQCSPSEMQKESQSIDKISKVPQLLRLEKPVRITEQVWPEGTVPVVTIKCITYQHVNFIRDAIEGFLMQETTFPVEILIHDDASTDGTADIVREYQAKYPRLIRTVLQTENQWLKGIKPRTFLDPMVRGEFIALCEGDDYWTSSHKLAKQIDFLESSPDASLVFHNTWVSHEDSKNDYFQCQGFDREAATLRDIIEREWFIATASIVYRRSNWAFDRLFGVSFGGDFVLLLSAASQGVLRYIDKVWSVYRKHDGGLSKTVTHSLAIFHERMRINHVWVFAVLREELPQRDCDQSLDRRITELLRGVALHKLKSEPWASAKVSDVELYLDGCLKRDRPRNVELSADSRRHLHGLCYEASLQAVTEHQREGIKAFALRGNARGVIKALRESNASAAFNCLQFVRLALHSFLQLGNAKLKSLASHE